VESPVSGANREDSIRLTINIEGLKREYLERILLLLLLLLFDLFNIYFGLYKGYINS
jgi:hypothetical protein